jgi:hypothetical protein
MFFHSFAEKPEARACNVEVKAGVRRLFRVSHSVFVGMHKRPFHDIIKGRAVLQ